MRGDARPSVSEIAFVAHEANRVLTGLQDTPEIPVAPHWYDATAEQRESVTDGVVHAQIGVTPEQNHKNWCAFKRSRGWTYGPVKDEVDKVHPLLVPYDELPESQKVKDRLFLAIVSALS